MGLWRKETAVQGGDMLPYSCFRGSHIFLFFFFLKKRYTEREWAFIPLIQWDKQLESIPSKGCWYCNLIDETMRPILPFQWKGIIFSRIFFASTYCVKYIWKNIVCISSHLKMIKIHKIQEEVKSHNIVKLSIKFYSFFLKIFRIVSWERCVIVNELKYWMTWNETFYVKVLGIQSATCITIW